MRPPDNKRKGPPRAELPGLPFPCLCAALRWATRAVTRAYEVELGACGLHPQQHALLRVLEALGPLPQIELAERALIDKTSLSRTLQPMLAAGWITAVSGADRRQKVIALAPAGQKLLDRSLAAWDRAQQKMKERLGAAGWANAIQAIRDLERATRP